MALITIDIPDEWVAQLHLDPVTCTAWLQDILAVSQPLPRQGDLPPATPLYRELLDLLAANPTPAQLIAFKISAEAQERLDDVLDQHREASLPPQLQAELETYLHLSHVVTRLKVQARQASLRPTP